MVVINDMIWLMSVKMEEPILHVYGWVNVNILVVVAILYSHMIHGSHIPSLLQYRDPDW